MKITFIQIGGTIDKEYPRMTKGYAFEIGEPAVKRILEKVNPNFEHEIISLLKKDSLDLTDDDRAKILEACRNAVGDKIIITHGTDTMIETADKLSEIQNKTIIITGSMRPEKFSDSDAMFNVGAAVIAVQTVPKGIYIAMNGKVYGWNEVKRNKETGQFVDK
ncbi:MAG: asparaginase [Candidatus Moraniibacteriota bacterium]|nr:MAG: asparaginase [Candidatus Moranbacteria bacterium]